MTLPRALVPLALVSAVWASGCGGGSSEASSTAATEATATAATTATGGSSGEGDPKAGEIVFVNEGCGGCHTLADAGVTGSIDDAGSIGPDLDEAKPSFDLVVERVTNGKGAMPSFQGDISEKDIRDVAAYVSSVAGG